MEAIKSDGCSYELYEFVFHEPLDCGGGVKYLYASREMEKTAHQKLKLYPLEKWHRIDDMYRLALSVVRGWRLYINGTMYFLA